MDNDKENILKLFNGGATIKGISDCLYAQKKQSEKLKNANERTKITLIDVKKIVEFTIYENYMQNLSKKIKH
jgi:hypothetical protein